jgi:hypothetical protein
MFVHAIFARFGRQNRVFGQNATEREKKPDWMAEKVGFERAVAFPQHSFASTLGLERGAICISFALRSYTVQSARFLVWTLRLPQTGGIRTLWANRARFVRRNATMSSNPILSAIT